MIIAGDHGAITISQYLTTMVFEHVKVKQKSICSDVARSPKWFLTEKAQLLTSTLFCPKRFYNLFKVLRKIQVHGTKETGSCYWPTGSCKSSQICWRFGTPWPTFDSTKPPCEDAWEVDVSWLDHYYPHCFHEVIWPMLFHDILDCFKSCSHVETYNIFVCSKATKDRESQQLWPVPLWHHPNRCWASPVGFISSMSTEYWTLSIF